MKLVLEHPGRRTVEVAEAPEPTCQSGQVLIRTTCSAVSPGTERAQVLVGQQSLAGKARARPDLVRKVLETARARGLSDAVRIVRDRLGRARPIGYSAAGVVLEVSATAAGGLAVGDRVACAGVGYANHAEVNSVPRLLCAKVPAEVPDAHASLSAIAAIALHAARQGALEGGEVVCVMGLGLVGQLLMQVLRAFGATVIGLDPDPRTEPPARACGFAQIFTGPRFAQGFAAARRLTGGAGPDAVFLCASSKSRAPARAAERAVRSRGTLVVVGNVPAEFDRETLYRKEVTVRVSRSYGPGRYDAAYEERGHDYPLDQVRWTAGRNLSLALQLMEDGRLNLAPLITHQLPLERAAEFYRELAAGRTRPMAAVFTYARSAGAQPTAAEGASPRTAPASPKPMASPPSRPPLRVAPPGTVRVSVIGPGNHLRDALLPVLAARKDCALRLVASGTGHTGASLVDRWKFEGAASAEEVLADPRTDVVVIGTRHDTHARLVAQALDAGKHVFVEKPLALDAAQLAEVEAAHRRSGAVLQVGFNRRHAPHVAALRQTVRALGGPFVATYRVNAGALPDDHWIHDPAQGGGRLLGEACHFVDLLIHLFGPVAQVVATGTTPATRPLGSSDDFAVALRHASGSLSTLVYASGGEKASGKERLEVFGGGASATLDDFRALDVVGAVRPVKLRARSQQKGYAEELAQLFSAVRGAELDHTARALADALHTTAVCLAALASLQRGNAVDPCAFEPGRGEAEGASAEQSTAPGAGAHREAR